MTVVNYAQKPKSPPNYNDLYRMLNPGNSPGASTYNQNLQAALNPAAPTAAKYSQYDFTSQPQYQDALALGQKSVADAEAAASAAKQQALIGYGYNDSLASLFGGDQNLIDSAKNNPFSYLSNLQHQYDQGNQAADQQYTQGHAGLLDALNKSNLFYGSAGKNALGDALNSYTNAQSEGARNYQGSLSTGAGGLASLLGQINTGVLTAQQKAASDQQAAAQNAYIQALLEAIANGTPPPAPPGIAQYGHDPNAADPNARNYVTSPSTLDFLKGLH